VAPTLLITLLFAAQAQDPTLPVGALARFGKAKFHHDSSITQGVFSAEGSTLFTSSYDETIRGWDVSTGRELMRLPGDSGWVLGLALSPDEKSLASAGKDGTVRVWDLATRTSTTKLAGHTGPVKCVRFTKDGAGLYSGGEDGLILEWDWKAGKKIRTLKGHEDHVLTLALSPDGILLASGGKDARIRMWHVGSGLQKKVLEGHEINVNSLSFSPDGSRLASGSGWDWVPFHEKDRSVRVWEIATGKELFRGTGFNRSVQLVAFAPDGGSVISASSDKSVRVWEVPSGRDITPSREPLTYWTSALLTPDGKKIVTLAHSARFWDLATLKELNPMEMHTGEVRALAYSPDGMRLATAGTDRRIRIWDAATGQPMHTLEGHQGAVMSLAYSPDGRYLASGSIMSPGGEVRLWDARTGRFLREQLERRSGKFLAFFKTRPALVFGEKQATVWDHEKGEVVTSRPLATDGAEQVVAFELLPDDRTLLLSDTAGGLALFDTTTGTREGAFPVAKSEGNHSWMPCDVSPDGRLMVSAGQGALKLWDVATRRELRSVPLEKVHYHASIVFSPDGRWFTSNAHDKSVWIWESSTGTVAFRLPLISDPTAVVFGPQGRTVTTGGWDGRVFTWDLAPWAYGAKKPEKPDPTDLWKTLLEKDGGEAYLALWTFASEGPEGIRFLAGELTRPAPGPAEIQKLIAGLEDPELEKRENVSRQLIELGPDIESILAEAMKGVKTPETVERLRAILDLINRPMPASREIVRRLRALHALELAGNADAVAALKSISTTSAGARIRREAAAAVERLKAQ
jgi:WD40 repeat protein